MFGSKWLAVAFLSAGVLLLGGDQAEAKAKAKAKKGNNSSAVFAKLDTNGDGKLSQEEFAKGMNAKKGKAAKGKKAAGIFAKLDANNDGFLSKSEFAANTKAKKKMK